MEITPVTLAREVQYYNEQHKADGPQFYLVGGEVPVELCVRFAAVKFKQTLLYAMFAELGEGVRNASGGCAAVSSDEELLKKGMVNIAINPCAKGFSYLHLSRTIHWLRERIEMFRSPAYDSRVVELSEASRHIAE